MADIALKKKEAKTLTFTVTDSAGNPVDLSSTTLTFAVKSEITSSSTEFTKTDIDFDKTDAIDGIVTVILTTDDTDRTGTFVGELKIAFSSTSIDKSANITVTIDEAVTA